ncbi:hypothetical protein BDY21DRAFT_307638 [Lineolata rhizophorae]|uniref:DUF1750-domain-containing protein n=1 Tax=Lineolata rhizophorae TaxID=578093 RepID=A0A6A6NVB8_9PEZI|nr:hypothetical protein BDY21DRAFT_307638 [Lineolata rhizophorae]
MQDPFDGVPHLLLEHLHLTANYNYPTTSTLRSNQAIEYLVNAPRLIRDRVSVSWSYQTTPPDGSLFLEWFPTGNPRRGDKFASDGYIWVDPEQKYAQNIGGYDVEFYVHHQGFRVGESFTSHMRTRYRIAQRHPLPPNSAPPDPSLWLVHYQQQTDPRYRMPVNQLPVGPDVQATMAERRSIETQGQLLRKEFHLHDRSNWPRVEFHGRGPMAAGPGLAQQGVGPSPAKRPRQGPGPQQMPGAAAASAYNAGPDAWLEDEESTHLGDVFDFLTPREISSMRYQQHHEWMEEIFSSPFAISQIQPVDLGFGLPGDLAELTDGLFDAPGPQSWQAVRLPETLDRPAVRSAAERSASNDLPDQAKASEFEKRVAKYVERSKSEIDGLKKEHSKTLAELKRSKMYMTAERKLQKAMEEGDDKASESIPVEVERTLGVRIEPWQDVACIDKGGLIEEEKQPDPQQTQYVNGDSDMPASNGDGNSGELDEGMDPDNTAAGLLDQYGAGSFISTPNTNVGAVGQSRPVSQGPSAMQSPRQTSAGAEAEAGGDAQDESLLMDAMDLDVDMDGLTGDMDAGSKVAAGDDWVIVGDEKMEDTAAKRAPGGGGAASQAEGDGPTEARADAPPPASAPAASAPVPQTTAASTPGMFESAEFANFDNLDTAGDALADYAGGGGDDLGLDLDNSAFGDAFHGTEGEGEGDGA